MDTEDLIKKVALDGASDPSDMAWDRIQLKLNNRKHQSKYKKVFLKLMSTGVAASILLSFFLQINNRPVTYKSYPTVAYHDYKVEIIKNVSDLNSLQQIHLLNKSYKKIERDLADTKSKLKVATIAE